jgi:putative oxidoreductase
MNSRIGRLSEALYSLMRFVVGVLFACHGAQKLFGAFGAHPATGRTLMLIAGIIEFAGGVLIALGLFARIAAFVAAGEMAVAYFTSHAPHGFWPIVNKGELAVVYCFVFLFIAFHGAGRYTLGGMLRGRRAF